MGLRSGVQGNEGLRLLHALGSRIAEGLCAGLLRTYEVDRSIDGSFSGCQPLRAPLDYGQLKAAALAAFVFLQLSNAHSSNSSAVISEPKLRVHGSGTYNPS